MATRKTNRRVANSAPSDSRTAARQRHKKRARLLMWRRLVVILLLFIGVWLVWRNWDVLAPDKLLANLQDTVNDAAGTYPVDISGTEGRALMRAQNYTVLLDDSYLTYYNGNGGEVTRYACSYSSVLTRTAGKYVLVAEQGGKRLLLTTRSAKVAELALDHPILSVALNSKGQIAVLTEGTQGYAVDVTVYTAHGEEIYRRSRAALASEVALSADGKTVALISVDAAGGVLTSTVEAFSLSSTESAAMYTHKATDTLLYRLAFFNNRCLAAVGDDGALLLPLKGTAAAYTLTGETLIGYAVADGSVALVTRTAGATDGGAVVLLDDTGHERCRVSFTGEFRQLSADGRRFLLLTDSVAQVIDRSGAGRAAEIAADGKQAVLSGNAAIVLGLSALQQYTLA